MASRTTKEWRIVARVLDRIFFFCYIGTIVVSLFTIFPRDNGQHGKDGFFLNATQASPEVVAEDVDIDVDTVTLADLPYLYDHYNNIDDNSSNKWGVR